MTGPLHIVHIMNRFARKMGLEPTTGPDEANGKSIEIPLEIIRFGVKMGLEATTGPDEAKGKDIEKPMEMNRFAIPVQPATDDSD